MTRSVEPARRKRHTGSQAELKRSPAPWPPEKAILTYRSADEYLNALGGLLQVTIRLDVKGVIAQGEDAAVFLELETRAPAEGKVLVAEWHQLTGGPISHVRSALGGRPYAAMFASAGHK